MRTLDLTLATPADNLALDEALLLAAEAGDAGEVLRLWEWPDYAVVLGSGGKLADDVDQVACDADGVPILRRSSGGGTVLLGTGCLCFSLVLRFDRHEALTEVRPSYHYILGRVLEAFALEDSAIDGISDLTWRGRKFSGNAQQRKRHHVLHHGTILYAFDLPRVGRYLRQPPRQPEYRANRPHQDFVGNLDVSRPWLAARLVTAWQGDQEAPWSPELVQRLVAEKYGSAEWTTRR